MSRNISRPRVYVAGPIAGQTYEGATGWRDYVQSLLPGCEILTPMRGKEYLEQLPSMPLTSTELVSQGQGRIVNPKLLLTTLQESISSERGIIKRDTWDVQQCDLVLANFLPGDKVGKVSIGTACEVYLAGYLRTPVVSVLTRTGIHDHPFITGSSWVVVDTLEEGFHAARIALNLHAPRPDVYLFDDPALD